MNIYVIPTLPWPWLISSSAKSQYALLTHKKFSTDTFLLIIMDYLPSVVWGDRQCSFFSTAASVVHLLQNTGIYYGPHPLK